MNIFYLSNDPKECAEWAVDKHVVKMILESAQLLSTAHRVLDGTMYFDTSGKRKVKRWRLPGERDWNIYQATHVNHPCAVWARESDANYGWLWQYLYHHCREYNHRYGKIHKIEGQGISSLLAASPNNIPSADWSIPPQAMPNEYKCSDTIQAYRNYYKLGKSHLHTYTKRQAPAWLYE